MNRANRNPKNDGTLNLPMLPGTVNFLTSHGFLYLKITTAKLTNVNVINNPRLANSATTLISPIRINNIVTNIIKKIAIHGVLVFLSTNINFFGSDFSSAIP